MPKIILVDDSNELLDVMKYFLEEAGHEVRTVTSGSALMAELSNFTPDVILLDVLLSGENGKDICSFLKNKQETKNLPVILMSASDKALENYSSCNADDIIPKPFNLADVMEKIKSVLKNHPYLITPFILGLTQFTVNSLHQL